jgi:oxalate decarboxylase/phosphoglucose isomerase-like protein (cupin superfamily)
VASLSDCIVIDVIEVKNGRGILSIVENPDSLPFKIKRVFYLYDIPAGESRGAHAHKECSQFLIAASGSFDVLLNDGESEKRIALNRPSKGLLIPPGIWASEENFSGGSVCLVLTSEIYIESDYIRDYGQFITYRAENT